MKGRGGAATFTPGYTGLHWETTAHGARVTLSLIEPRVDGAPELSPAAAAEWMRHVEGILRGVGHALNNRASAIAAAVELLASDGNPGDAAAGREIAADEARRIAEVARLIRSLSDIGGGRQAFAPADVAAEAAAVLALHHDFRLGAPAFEAAAAVPVRTHRALLLRALIALAPADTAPARVSLVAEGDWLVVTAAPAAAALTPLATELARAMGGDPLNDGRYGFRIPTLATLRRREGR